MTDQVIYNKIEDVLKLFKNEQNTNTNNSKKSDPEPEKSSNKSDIDLQEDQKDINSANSQLKYLGNILSNTLTVRFAKIGEVIEIKLDNFDVSLKCKRSSWREEEEVAKRVESAPQPNISEPNPKKQRLNLPNLEEQTQSPSFGLKIENSGENSPVNFDASNSTPNLENFFSQTASALENISSPNVSNGHTFNPLTLSLTQPYQPHNNGPTHNQYLQQQRRNAQTQNMAPITNLRTLKQFCKFKYCNSGMVTHNPTVTSKLTGKTFKVDNPFISCKDMGVYSIECKQPGCKYQDITQTNKPFREQLRLKICYFKQYYEGIIDSKNRRLELCTHYKTKHPEVCKHGLTLDQAYSVTYLAESKSFDDLAGYYIRWRKRLMEGCDSGSAVSSPIRTALDDSQDGSDQMEVNLGSTGELNGFLSNGDLQNMLKSL